MTDIIETEYSIGQIVKHKYLDFRGVIYDVDPEFLEAKQGNLLPVMVKAIQELSAENTALKARLDAAGL